MSGVPLVASAAQNTHADAELFERGFFPGGLRIAEHRRPRPQAVTLAPAHPASTPDAVAAPVPAPAASRAAPQAPHAAPQLAVPTGTSAPSHQAHPTSSQSFFQPHLVEVTGASSPLAPGPTAPATMASDFSAPAHSASTFDSVAAPLPALAASIAASQAPLAAPHVETSSFLAPSAQAPLAATQPTPWPYSSKTSDGAAPSSGSLSTESWVNAAELTGRPGSDSDDDCDKNRRVNKAELERNNNRMRVRFRI